LFSRRGGIFEKAGALRFLLFLFLGVATMLAVRMDLGYFNLTFGKLFIGLVSEWLYFLGLLSGYS
jgi:hypothetical protein